MIVGTDVVPTTAFISHFGLNKLSEAEDKHSRRWIVPN